MFKLAVGSLCMFLGLIAVSAGAMVGCAEHAEEPVGETGTLSAALTTTGSDGASYSFPVGTYLQLSTSTFTESVPLDGPDALLQRQLPAGSYTATLYYSTSSVVLERTESGVTTTVEAQWTNPQPVTFDILDEQTTALILHFTVQGLTDLTFDTGTLQVGADVVEEEVEQAGAADISGTTNFYQEEYADPAAAYAGALDVELGVDYSAELAFTATGDWTQYGSTAVCKPGTFDAVSASGSSGLGLRAEQLVGAAGYLCIYDYGAADGVSLSLSRYGAAPSGQASVLPDPNYGFYGSLGAAIGDVYDGETLQQTALEDAVPVTNGYFGHYIYDSSSTLLTQVAGVFNGTIQLAP